jgi:putative oxidoreductase
MSNDVRIGLTVLRVAVACVFVVHGIARIVNGTVGGFGQFLGASGFPLGVAIAWTLTLVEVAGGVALALGFCVRPLAVWYAAEILTGIALVHWSEGWFVVGAGRGGMEYSVLIVACLAAVFLADRAALRPGGGTAESADR